MKEIIHYHDHNVDTIELNPKIHFVPVLFGVLTLIFIMIVRNYFVASIFKGEFWKSFVSPALMTVLFSAVVYGLFWVIHRFTKIKSVLFHMVLGVFLYATLLFLLVYLPL